jgi:hypothetical protein
VITGRLSAAEAVRANPGKSDRAIADEASIEGRFSEPEIVRRRTMRHLNARAATASPIRSSGGSPEFRALNFEASAYPADGSILSHPPHQGVMMTCGETSIVAGCASRVRIWITTPGVAADGGATGAF